MPSPFSPLYSQIKFKPRLNVLICEQAHSQKFTIRGAALGVWGLSPHPPEAIGGLGVKPTAAGGTEVWGGVLSARKFGIFLQKVT